MMIAAALAVTLAAPVALRFVRRAAQPEVGTFAGLAQQIEALPALTDEPARLAA